MDLTSPHLYRHASAQRVGSEESESSDSPSRDSTFEAIFETHWPEIRRFFQARGLRYTDSEDLAQDTMFRFFRYLERGSENIQNPTALLLQIASNVWKNHLRSQAAQKRRALEFSVEDVFPEAQGVVLPEPSPEQATLRRETIERLRSAIDRLPPRQQQILLLQLKGHSYQDIAALLQVSQGAVKKPLHLAREKLREVLSRHLESEDQLSQDGDSKA